MAKTANGSGKLIIAAVIGFLVIVAAAFAFGVMRPSDTTAVDDASKRFKVAYLPIYVDLPLFIAEQEGLFKKRGLDVTLVRFESSPDMSTALVGNQVDAVASIATPTALSVQNRDAGKFKIFMVDQATIDAPLSSLVLPKGSSIASIADLKGKTVGAFPGPTTTTLSPLAFAVDGLAPGDLRIVDVPPSNHLELLNSGTIDALVTYEPTATQAVVKDGATLLVRGFIETKLMNPWPAGSWLISSAKLDTPEEEAASKLFYEAIYEATDMLRKNPDAMKAHLAEYTLIDTDVARQAPNIAFTKSGEADTGALQRYADLLFRERFIDRPVVTNELLIEVGK